MVSHSTQHNLIASFVYQIYFQEYEWKNNEKITCAEDLASIVVKYTERHKTGVKGDHVLVIMFQPFKGKWVQALACFLSKNNVSGTILHHLVIECTILMENAGYFVDVVTSDGASWNRKMWSQFGISLDNVSCSHPCNSANSSRRLWFVSDFPHLIKNVRNAVVNKKYMMTPVGDLKLEFWEAVVELDIPRGLNLKACPQLKYDHVHPKGYQKMNVAMAFQAIFQLLASEVTVKCRKQDVDLVEKSLDSISKEYLSKVGKPCKITVDKDNFLAPDSQSSNLLNQARLKVLKAREDHIKVVLEDGRKQLYNKTKDTARYQEVLKNLILQLEDFYCEYQIKLDQLFDEEIAAVENEKNLEILELKKALKESQEKIEKLEKNFQMKLPQQESDEQYEIERLQNAFWFNFILSLFQNEKVNKDFLWGENGAIKLTQEDICLLTELYKTIEPDLSTCQAEHFFKLSEVMYNLLEGSSKEVIGSTYNVLKDLIISIKECAYFKKTQVPPLLFSSLSISSIEDISYPSEIPSNDDTEQPMSAYERRALKRRAESRALLESLGISSVVAEISQVLLSKKSQTAKKVSKRPKPSIIIPRRPKSKRISKLAGNDSEETVVRGVEEPVTLAK